MVVGLSRRSDGHQVPGAGGIGSLGRPRQCRPSDALSVRSVSWAERALALTHPVGLSHNSEKERVGASVAAASCPSVSCVQGCPRVSVALVELGGEALVG
jgi:hypothetical protein